MSQIYQTRRREPPSAVPAAPSYGGFYARSGGEADGGTYSGPVPLSASAVPASAAGPMQAKKDITKAKEQAASEGQSIPSIFHPSQRAAAKDYYLSRWHAARLRDEFDSIDLGDTEESRRAGRQRQVEMLLEMQEVANDNSALGGRGQGSDFGNVGRVLSEIMNDLSSDQKNGPDNIIEVINAIQDARLAAAQQAKEKYENGEYGEQGTLDADARMAISPENHRFKNGGILLATMNVSSRSAAFPRLQQLLGLEGHTANAEAPSEAQEFLTTHAKEETLMSGLGPERYGQFVDEEKRSTTAKVADWYRRKFGRVVRTQPRRRN